MQEIRLGASGLWTDPSELEAPKGALREALNVRIKRANTIEPRPGFPATTIGASNGRATIQQTWNGAVACVVGTKLYSIIQGGAQSEITDVRDASSLSITYAESCLVPTADTLLVPTDDGIFSVDSGGVCSPAGLKRSLPPMPTLATGNVLADDEHCSLRSVIVSEVYGGRLIFSAPSDAVEASNESGTGKGVTVRVSLSDDVRAGMRVQVYRTEVVGIATPTGDEMYMVRDVTLEAADITAGYLDVVLATTDTLGASLYSNETQEGILQANTRPPRAKRIAWFSQMAFYADIEARYLYEIEADPTSSGGVAAIYSASVTAAGTTISGLPVDHGIKVGAYVSIGDDIGADDATFAGFTRVATAAATSVTIDTPALGTLSGNMNFHDVITIAGNEYVPGVATYFGSRQFGTIEDFAALINADGAVVCTVIGTGATPRFRLEADAAFSASAVAASANSIIGLWGSTPEAATTNSDAWPARLMWSKTLQPESVPEVNYIDIGRALEPILGLGVTRDALFVLKTDGVWRVSGQTPETLRVDEFDRSVRAIHPRAIAEMDDMVWAWTSNGIVGISDGGIQRVSDPSIADLIEASQNNILALSRAASPLYVGGCFIGGCQQESALMVGVPASTAATSITSAEYVYVLETKTGAWVRWQSSFDWYSAGEHYGKIVFGGPDSLHFQATTLVDDDTNSVTLSAATASVEGPDGVTYPGSVTMDTAYDAGMRITRSGTSAWTIFDLGSNTVITDKLLTNGAGTYENAVQCRVEWVGAVAGNPSALAHWRNVQLLFGDASALPSVTVGFASERVPTEATVELRSFADTERPEPVVLRGSVTRAHARCARLRPSIDIQWAAQSWRLEGLALTFETQRGGERNP